MNPEPGHRSEEDEPWSDAPQQEDAESLPQILEIPAHFLEEPLLTRLIYNDKSQALYCSLDWSADFYASLARRGFISVALDHREYGPLLLPEIQTSYAVLDWKNLRVEAPVARILEREGLGPAGLELKLNSDPGPVMAAINAYHQDSWLLPPYQELLMELAREPRQGLVVCGVELYHRGELASGELGYFLGRSYTSLTGFFHRERREWNHFGKVQMVLLAQRLQALGCDFWNLGHPHMAYKKRLGARVLKRHQFLKRWYRALDEVWPGA